MVNERILLIEDDFDIAEMLTMFFQMRNYEVLHAETGAQGIELARSAFPSIILLDIMLPDMDGYDICSQLRHTALTKYIPTIFLTQKDARAAKVRGLELGADDYITKPFDIDELRLRIEGSIRRATRENLHEARTRLPTGSLAVDELSRLRDQGATLWRTEIVGFDGYADVYSFMAANEVMFHAGKTIRDALSENSIGFVGILGDDIYFATFQVDPAPLIYTMQTAFSQQVRAFYTFADAERGGILGDPGGEQEQLIPMMTLAFTAATLP